MTYGELLAHATGGQPLQTVATPEILDEVRLYMPHYLWIDNHEDGRTRTLICDGCMSTWTERKSGHRWPQVYQQEEAVKCPRCRGNVTPKHMGRSRRFRDTLDAVWYQKSRCDPGAVVAVAARFVRSSEEWEERPWMAETDASVRGVAVFVYGRGSARWQLRDSYTYDGSQWIQRREWQKINSPGHLVFEYMPTMGIRYGRVLLEGTFDEAIGGTPFERAWSDDYDRFNTADMDNVRAMAMIAAHPCIEYMTKLGYTAFLSAWLDGKLQPNAVNWNGKSIDRVLKLTRQRIGELRAAGAKLTPRLHAVLKALDRADIRVSVDDARALESLLITDARGAKRVLEDTLRWHMPNRRKKAVRYMARTARAGRKNLVMQEFGDYWQQCTELGANLADDAVAFPRDFDAAHDRCTARIKAMGNALLDKKIAQRLDALEKRFGFEYGGLLLRPAASSAEVIREGEALHHCVGGYVERYAEGRTVICVLRRAVEPDTPWRTVEITPMGNLVQDRGYKNDVATLGGIPLEGHYRQALDLFWDAWRERETA